MMFVHRRTLDCQILRGTSRISREQKRARDGSRPVKELIIEKKPQIFTLVDAFAKLATRLFLSPSP